MICRLHFRIGIFVASTQISGELHVGLPAEYNSPFQTGLAGSSRVGARGEIGGNLSRSWYFPAIWVDNGPAPTALLRTVRDLTEIVEEHADDLRPQRRIGRHHVSGEGEMKVFADTGPDCRARAPAYKAIVNGASGEVVSIVGSRYQVLRNRQALGLAQIACVSAFPNTQPEEWIPKGIEAARNGGSCAVDLDHERLCYDWKLAPGITDVFRPFIRFRNGYNGRTPFSVFFGFERSACTNGMIYEEKIAGIKVSHDTQDIALEIERKIQKANFRRVPGTFRHRLTVLCGVPVPRDLFTPVIHRVLGIRPPKEGIERRGAGGLGRICRLSLRMSAASTSRSSRTRRTR